MTIPTTTPIATLMRYLGSTVVLVCDRKCHKAWGLSSRPRDELDDGSVQLLSDSELPVDAPRDPGTYEGRSGKPRDGRHNKWCARECERSAMNPPGETCAVAPDWSKRVVEKGYHRAQT